MEKKKVAIVGTGIAGMGIAHFLQHDFDIYLFEQNHYIGGHTNTIEVEETDRKVAMDTGFMVFNFVTYPNLCRLFKEIQAPIKKTDMSFSVQYTPSGLEYCGSGLGGLFAQRKNIFNLSYIRMLMAISRFNSESVKDMNNPRYADYSLGEYIQEKKFGEEMLWKYLVPMSSAVWSTPMDRMLEFPAMSLIRFFYNHGFLGLNTQHQWYTLEGGSESYKKILIAPFQHKIATHKKVKSIRRNGEIISLFFEDNSSLDFDKLVFASHADQTLNILGKEATSKEQDLLQHFKYQANRATVHSDESIMPRNKKVWSSWNYRMDQKGSKSLTTTDLNASTIYWMNSLQGVSDRKNYFVSINDPGLIHPEKIISTIDYEHPLFNSSAIKAQQRLQELNQQDNNIYFCGSYFKYGFHEDAFASAVDCAGAILKRDPWEHKK